MAGSVIASEINLGTAIGEALPVLLKLFIELVSYTSGAATRAILRDANFGRMFDDSAPIVLRELHRDSADKMPCARSAGEKVGHGSEDVGRFVGHKIAQRNVRLHQ